MQFRFALRVITLLMLLLLSALPAAAALQLIYPEPGSAVVSSRHLVLKLGPEEISGVVVTINGVASDPLPVGTNEYKRAFRDFLILQPLWDKGVNKLTVETFGGDGKQLESFKAEIYYAPPPSVGEIPKEFKRTSLHRAEVEPLCTSCHNMQPTDKQVGDVPDKDNPCYGCHKRMGNQQFVHGPVGLYSCVQCHPLNVIPKYSVQKLGSKLCYDCHKDKQSEFKAFKFLHGPVVGGMCETCHDPHYSENPGQLRQPVNSLCLSCHESIGKGIHVTSVSQGKGHPISGHTDPSPRGRGRELSCISCHDPHGGKARHYFVTGNDNKLELCQTCHNK